MGTKNILQELRISQVQKQHKPAFPADPYRPRELLKGVSPVLPQLMDEIPELPASLPHRKWWGPCGTLPLPLQTPRWAPH